MIWYISTFTVLAVTYVTLFIYFRASDGYTTGQSAWASLVGLVLVIILFIGMSEVGERDIKVTQVHGGY